MSDGGVNKARRRLIFTTAAMGGVGGAFVAVPFLKSWNPSEKAKAAGAPVKQDVSKVELGQMVTLAWRGKPVYVVHRNQEAITNLNSLNDRLKDPDSANTDQQPKYALNEQRSRRSEYLVIEGVCTHLGCAPKFHPEVKPEPFDPEWKGGFYCPCHGSRFDLAGRVYSGSPASDNLKVPPHSYEDGNVLIVGVDEEIA